MYTALFLAQAAMQAFLLAWVLRIWRTSGAPGALVMLVPQATLVYDSLVIGLGSTLGLGPLLEALSWPRFWSQWLMGGWIIIVSGAVLRMAGFRWAQHRLGMGAFCLLTVGLMLYDLPHFWTDVLNPVCEKGLVRYAPRVSAATACFPGQLLVKSGPPPLGAALSGLIVIAVGALLWLRRGFPWLFVGSALAIASALPSVMPLKLDSLGEVCISAGVIWALAHFAPRRALATGGPVRAASGLS